MTSRRKFGRSSALLLTALVVLSPLACGGADAAHRATAPAASDVNDVWIRDVTVVSPERAHSLAHAHVVLRDGRIVWVDTKPPPLPAPANVIEGTGRFLVPGLIDGHVHLDDIPGVAHEDVPKRPELAAAYFKQLPRSYLYFGFTTVVDLGVIDPAAVARVRSAELAPTVLDCGNGLALVDGYPMAFAPPPLRYVAFPNFLYGPSPDASLLATYPAADHTPAAAVARVVAGRGACVKTYYETGYGAQRGKLPVPTVDLVKDVVARAHEQRLPVLLHANSLAAHAFAVATHVDAAAHGLWNWPAGADDAGGDISEGLPRAVRAVIDAEIRYGIGTMPTSRVMSGLEDLFVPDFLDDPRLGDVLPAELLAWYRTDAGKWFANETAKASDGAPPDRLRQALHAIGDRGRAASSYFAAHHGRLLFGSDTPSSPTYANPPGYNGYLEMRELEVAGIAPRDLLASATLSNAKLFGLEQVYGTVQAGKRAMLLLLASDPLESVSAFDRIEVVFVAGRPVAREELTARR
jgi:imidazolonepropionase-like amidohydrolase